MKQWIYRMMLVSMMVGLIVGCKTPAPTATTAVVEVPTATAVPTEAPTATPAQAAAEPAAGGDVALKITGMVEQEIGWTEDQIKAMDTMEAESTNKAGEVSTYTGVLIKSLLDLAQPKSGAQTVVYVADDGFTGEVPLSDVTACVDCIVSFRNQGGFSIVMPGFPGNVQVKGVIEIQVK